MGIDILKKTSYVIKKKKEKKERYNLYDDRIEVYIKKRN